MTSSGLMAVPLAVAFLLLIANEAAAARPITDPTTSAPTLCYQYDYNSNNGYTCTGVPNSGNDTVATKSECEDICNSMRSDGKSCLGFQFDSSTGDNATEGTCTFYASFTGRAAASTNYSCNALTGRRLCTDKPTNTPTAQPTSPTSTPSENPTSNPTSKPSNNPTSMPTATPSKNPTSMPTSTPSKNPTSLSTTLAPTLCYQYDYNSNNGYTCTGVPNSGNDTVATKSECEDICNGMRSDGKSCLGFQFDSSTGANAAEGTCTFYASFTGRAAAGTNYSCNALSGRRPCTSTSEPTKAPSSTPSANATAVPTKLPTKTPATSTPTVCYDLPSAWIADDVFYTCHWFEQDSPRRCQHYGDVYIDNNGINADTACCICGGGFKATTSPTLSPTESPTAGPTKTPTAISTAPTSNPTSVLNATPTNAPTSIQKTCTLMWADMMDASAPFSHVIHEQVIPTETLVTGIHDTGFVISAATQIARRHVDFKDPRGDPFNIGPVAGRISVFSVMDVEFYATVQNPNFYINRLGGIISSKKITASELDPRLSDVETAFQAANGDERNVKILLANSRVLGWDEDGNNAECTDSVTPHASCAGPWYTYAYIEVCAKDGFVATKNPTQVTAPTAFATSAPSASTPLINVVFTNSSTPMSIKMAFENARDIWNGIITNTNLPVDLPAGATNASTGGLDCGANTDFPVGTTSLSGLTIFADIAEIDGVGEILGQAGPCAFSYNVGSPTVFGNSMSRIGVMKFDVEDLQSMVDDGSLERIVLHEMGHILGLGPGWQKFRVGKASQAANNPRYVGARAVEGYKQVGGLSNDIPLANTGGSGTADAHWRESTFVDELMTGYATGPHTISIMTLKSLIDLGYVVDESKAEPYSISPTQTSDIKAEEGAPRTMLVDDILKFGEVGSLKPAA